MIDDEGRAVADSAIAQPARQRARSARPLLFTWVATVVVEGLLYWLTWRSPALTSLVMPLYLLALLPAAMVTWRWVRPRHDSNRREADRRRLFRRSRKTGRK